MDLEIGKIILRTIGTYILIVIIFRLMGKREIGELGILDLVVFIMVAEMAVFSIEDPKESVMRSVVPMLVLLAIQRLTAWISLKSKLFRKWFEGKPSIIVSRGKIDEHEMKKQRYNFDDLLMQLRQNGTKSVQDVEFAILEPSGKLSIFEKATKSSDTSSDAKGFVVPLILDGKIQTDALNKINHSKKWLASQLQAKGYPSIEDISFCSIDENNNWYIDEKNEKK
ncbi:DUF421 domain-containing protein [Aquibacillus sp. 3ASR75-11]|uniref:DUF421 domain-containing protein n=1 Tax=Terrihalobacillus insolitus TaxID=2950438 RepID=A0A9X3WTX9_9BACI|nr:DUF421 domain-containing protein [Terrihalobacillus insolitus]MDC3412436.1 DUF421 domain-containing protein [Terrihalobacillus insolitus]MDC3423856.1 DUF421 domain-containing protein [Terrihalobacillus insolitus]